MSRTALALAVVAALVAGPGCKKKPPPPVTPERPQPVEVRLQVTSISPSTVSPGVATPAKLYGSAFTEGAAVVFVGPQKAIGQEVRVESGNQIAVTIPSLKDGTYDVMVQNADGEQSTLRGGLTVRASENCGAATVNFDFDRSTIRGDAKSVLDANMSCYQKAAGAIRVEGHCDERGTVDYNLALGQRRADTVKQYLVSGGVSASRLTTTSYGEERPADRGHDEGAWARNRRAEILVSE